MMALIILQNNLDYDYFDDNDNDVKDVEDDVQADVEDDDDAVQGAGGREGAARPGRPGCCNCSIGQVVIIINIPPW